MDAPMKSGNVGAPKRKLDIKEILHISLVLMIICASVALILSFADSITRDRIEENEEAEQKSAITALFGGETIEYTPIETESVGINAIYDVKDGTGRLGYAVSVSPSGFGGNIDMMVGIDTAGKVLGVRIVSLSETPGLGTRVRDDAFLSAFVGKEGSVELGHGVDAISGSTISSRAVTLGVNNALSALNEYLAGGVVTPK